MKEITEYLINDVGMRRVYERVNSDKEFDWNKFSCVMRTGDIHYIFWSEHFKYFSIGVRHDKPKGKAGGGFEYWTYVMIPKVIDTIEKAAAIIYATVDLEKIKLYAQ